MQVNEEAKQHDIDNINEFFIDEINDIQKDNKMDNNTNSNNATIIDIDEEGNVTDVQEQTGFKKTFDSRQEANDTLDVLDQLGYSSNYDVADGGKSIVLHGLTEKDVAIIQRKVNITQWSKKTMAVANAVTDFATDVADYALNGALAPTTGAVINAAMTTGRVVATAGISIAAATAATTIRNGRKACREISRNRDVQDAWREVKGLGSDIGGFLFGGGSSNSDKKSNNSWEAC